MKKYNKKIIATLCGVTSITFGVFAQEVENIKSESWFERESLFIVPVVDNITRDSGFSPLVVWSGEVWDNVGGGTKTGGVVDSLLSIGFEQDISKIAGKDGWGTFGISAFWFAQSKRQSDWQGSYVGSVGQCASNIFSSDMVRVFEIYYANEFDTKFGTVGFRVGQLSADEDFMGLDYSDLFLNANLGAIPTNAGMELANGSFAFSQYSLATFGATIYWANENFDAIFGVYNGDAGRDSVDYHGFDYALQDVAIWYQIAYNYVLCGLNGRAQFGGNYHSGDFINKYNGNLGSDFYSFYFGLQQDFIADKNGNAILGGFVRIGYTPKEEISGCDKYLDCGLNWFAPLAGRQDDVLGLAFSAMKIGERDYEYDNLIELTYRAQITRAIVIQPTFQTYLNAKDEQGETNVAYVIGARVDINF